jgi:endonuclease YncB( thermonuclease family)
LIRLRRRRRLLWLVAVPLLGALIVADRSGCLLSRGRDERRTYHGLRAAVTRVIDATTLEIDLPDGLRDAPVTRLRLLGVSSAPPDPEAPQPGETSAAQAAVLARELVLGRAVRIELEPGPERDEQGRLCAHVELPDGRSLAEALLEAGLVRADDRRPHSRLGRHEEVERVARLQGRGIWAAPPERQ